MLVLGAENDAVFSWAEVERTAKAYGVMAHRIDATAHDIMLEERWKEAADIILGWLESRGL